MEGNALMTYSGAVWLRKLKALLHDSGLPEADWRFLPRRGVASGRLWLRAGSDIWTFFLPQESALAARMVKRIAGITKARPNSHYEHKWASGPVHGPIRAAIRRAHLPHWAYAWNGRDELWLDIGESIKVCKLTEENLVPVLLLISAIGKRYEPKTRTN
jgi:hypothetical protein